MGDGCCSDYTRARLLKAAVARAGRGLPPIEPGMPAPAGTGMRRRTFLSGAAGLALSVYGAAHGGLPSFEEGIAQAAGTGPGPVLVSIFMPGGVDSMSLLAPVGDPKYQQLRPTLKLAPGAGPELREDPRLMWHPAAQGLSKLYAEGKVSVFPAIGYDHPDQSHFTSRHYWEVGELNPKNQLGWLGRYLDAAGTPDNPLQGLSLSYGLSPTLATARNPVAALESPQSYTFSSPGVWNPVSTPMLGAMGGLGSLPTPSSEVQLAGARGVASAAGRLLTQLSAFVTPDGDPHYNSPVAYPANSNFAQRLAGLAAMIAGGLPLRVVTVDADDGDFDTHAEQGKNFAPRIQGVMDALLAFQRDLEARGLAGRVLISLWSEFGRRPGENGSGTDHGAAGSAFVIGERSAATMVGEFPGLDVLDDNDNLRATSDFRGLYCSLLEQWLGTDAVAVIPGAGSFARPKVVR
ncbi:MAG TPA: DUF1501 domain-containing protein [Solirubrobacteraceae bacterium]|nr:DUF1501 domain-containing protein [Solirubrobacteraceae bacterium]